MKTKKILKLINIFYLYNLLKYSISVFNLSIRSLKLCLSVDFRTKIKLSESSKILLFVHFNEFLKFSSNSSVYWGIKLGIDKFNVLQSLDSKLILKASVFQF